MKHTGICSNCHFERKITRKGLVKKHWHPYAEGLRTCRGGGKPPYVREVSR